MQQILLKLCTSSFPKPFGPPQPWHEQSLMSCPAYLWWPIPSRAVSLALQQRSIKARGVPETPSMVFRQLAKPLLSISKPRPKQMAFDLVIPPEHPNSRCGRGRSDALPPFVCVQFLRYLPHVSVDQAEPVRKGLILPVISGTHTFEFNRLRTAADSGMIQLFPTRRLRFAEVHPMFLTPRNMSRDWWNDTFAARLTFRPFWHTASSMVPRE